MCQWMTGRLATRAIRRTAITTSIPVPAHDSLPVVVRRNLGTEKKKPVRDRRRSTEPTRAVANRSLSCCARFLSSASIRRLSSIHVHEHVDNSAVLRPRELWLIGVRIFRPLCTLERSPICPSSHSHSTSRGIHNLLSVTECLDQRLCSFHLKSTTCFSRSRASANGLLWLTHKVARAALSAPNIEYGVPSAVSTTALRYKSPRSRSVLWREASRNLSRHSRDRDTMRNDRRVYCLGAGAFTVFRVARGEQRPARYHTFGHYFLHVLTE
jgi:hypothetical protein